MTSVLAPRPGSLAARLRPSTDTVLVVDDDPDIALFLRAFLRASGVETVHLNPLDGREVVELTTTLAPRCVLLDHQLSPDLTSFEVLDALRATGDGTPVIVMTADATFRAADARTAGATTLVRKPFSVSRLAETVRRAVEGEQLAAETR